MRFIRGYYTAAPMILVHLICIPCFSSTFPDRLSLPRTKLRNLLERIFDLIVLSHPVLSSLLRDDMLHHRLLGHLLQKLPDKPRIPKLASHAQVLAAPHQRIRFAALCRSRDSIRVKILLLASRDRDQSR